MVFQVTNFDPKLCTVINVYFDITDMNHCGLVDQSEHTDTKAHTPGNCFTKDNRQCKHLSIGSTSSLVSGPTSCTSTTSSLGSSSTRAPVCSVYFDLVQFSGLLWSIRLSWSVFEVKWTSSYRQDGRYPGYIVFRLLHFIFTWVVR